MIIDVAIMAVLVGFLACIVLLFCDFPGWAFLAGVIMMAGMGYLAFATEDPVCPDGQSYELGPPVDPGTGVPFYPFAGCQ